MSAFKERRTNGWRTLTWPACAAVVLLGLVLVMFRSRAHQPSRGAPLSSAAQLVNPEPKAHRVPPLAADHPRFRPSPRLARGDSTSLQGAAPSPSGRGDGAALALLRRASDAMEREDYAEALRDAQECLEVDPSDRDCFDDELMVYGRTGDFTNERILAEECLFDDPDDVGCLEAIVTVDARDRDFDSARKAADHLRQVAPNSTSSALADAVIADLSGNHAAALAEYERACGLGQEYACFRAQAIRNGVK